MSAKVKVSEKVSKAINTMLEKGMTVDNIIEMIYIKDILPNFSYDFEEESEIIKEEYPSILSFATLFVLGYEVELTVEEKYKKLVSKIQEMYSTRDTEDDSEFLDGSTHILNELIDYVNSL